MKTLLPSCVAVVLTLAIGLGDAHAAPSDPTDQKFAKKAAAGGMLEVKLGEVAQKNAQSPEVKSLGP